mmetsp:Transcript_20056/g.17748  ORF Transcript_20056/g.17748 Transcript_20056/m.17748 type:complete len:146 (+) Transcript_20056:600-1037(+)
MCYGKTLEIDIHPSLQRNNVNTRFETSNLSSLCPNMDNEGLKGRGFMPASNHKMNHKRNLFLSNCDSELRIHKDRNKSPFQKGSNVKIIKLKNKIGFPEIKMSKTPIKETRGVKNKIFQSISSSKIITTENSDEDSRVLLIKLGQ